MQSRIEYIEPTKAKLVISANASDLNISKQAALNKLSGSVKVAGYRPGKAPLSAVEKQLDPNLLSQEALDFAISEAYYLALNEHKLRPISRPEISVKSYVPYETLTFDSVTEVIGGLKLGNYSGLKIKKPPVVVVPNEISDVIARLQKQLAKRTSLKRPAKSGDEVIIDFDGQFADSGEPIEGASGKDYPLELGSKSFIPGFETKIVGMKPQEKREIELVFPKDYQAAFLRGKAAKFSVTLKTLNSLTLPKLDDAFAKQVGTFSTLAELKKDIERELSSTKQSEANKQYQNLLLERIIETTQVDIPKLLIDDESTKLEREIRDSASYRGLTWEEYLASEGISEPEFKKQILDQSLKSVKAGLVLGEIAAELKIQVDPSEVKERIAALKQQYSSDAAMQAELDKEQNRNDLQNRILVEKTVQRLVELNSD
ncbi:MAG: trigger factor [Candidatus Saccharimonadales bacterium]